LRKFLNIFNQRGDYKSRYFCNHCNLKNPPSVRFCQNCSKPFLEVNHIDGLLSDDILKLDNSNKLLEHGDTFYKKGEFTSAILCYEKLINNNNNDGKLWIKLGNSFLALKNYKNALFCYKKALYYNDDNKLRLKLIKKLKSNG